MASPAPATRATLEQPGQAARWGGIGPTTLRTPVASSVFETGSLLNRSARNYFRNKART